MPVSSVNIGNKKSNKPLSCVLVVVERIISPLSSTTGSSATSGVSGLGLHPTNIANTSKKLTTNTKVFFIFIHSFNIYEKKTAQRKAVSLSSFPNTGDIRISPYTYRLSSMAIMTLELKAGKITINIHFFSSNKSY